MFIHMGIPEAPFQAISGLGQNREDVRQHNLSVVLRTLHTQGTVSRSALTASTGLNRSTISDLVTELEDLGLAVESEAESSSGVGRPSLMVSASDKVVAFAVHPEVDATTVGVVSLSGKILAKERVPSYKSPTAALSAEIATETIARMRKELATDIRIAGVGVAVPGQVRVSDGVIRHAPHLGWIEEPFASMLSQATSLPVWLDNDATIGCTAERNFGSARGYSDVVYLFAGSGGIGGGAIIDGRQLRGSAGYAGELGHVRIATTSSKDYSGLSGTLESLVRRDDLLEIFKMFSATDEELESEILSAKTPKAVRAIEEQIDALGIGLGTFVSIFNPQVIVLAGFLVSLFKFNSERMLNKMRESSLTSSQERVVIRPGELGSNLLIVGAVELAFNNLITKPSTFNLVPARKGR